MKNLYCAVAALVLALAGQSNAALAAVVFQTGFEAPTYAPGTINGQDGWTVFNTAANVTIQSTVVKSGAQAVQINGSVAGQSGPHHAASSAGPLVLMEIDAFLTSSTSQSSFQFSGMNSFTSGGFIGGFNTHPTNGTLQIQSPGFPQTAAPVIVRDVWQHWAVLFDFPDQTFDIYIDGAAVALDNPFLNPFTSFEVGFFDVFGSINNNDIGYFDNFSITAMAPAPGTIVLMLAALGLVVFPRTRALRAA